MQPCGTGCARNGFHSSYRRLVHIICQSWSGRSSYHILLHVGGALVDNLVTLLVAHLTILQLVVVGVVAPTPLMLNA
eukprot:2411622-Heterocapsa_arctica.AAC.1